jgi:hypothetical protein
MVSSEVQRTLVKSPPELWAELSDPAALARHLSELGEIRIVKTKPEERVEWEADGATGTVLLKASGWGTKVTLSVTRELDEPQIEPPVAAEPTPEAEPDPEPDPEPPVEPRRGFFSRLFRRRPEPQATIPEPTPPPEPPAEPPVDIAAELKAAEDVAAEEVTAVLTAALDRLGAAHHRPFSRS